MASQFVEKRGLIHQFYTLSICREDVHLIPVGVIGGI